MHKWYPAAHPTSPLTSPNALSFLCVLARRTSFWRTLEFSVARRTMCGRAADDAGEGWVYKSHARCGFHFLDQVQGFWAYGGSTSKSYDTRSHVTGVGRVGIKTGVWG
ncbi:hypothetical protein GGTG_01522 [Gaeumannomyces tritici R3-111a-1]|uniref:Uncharacterized protein n=1 Tax=Gaeumannomyces tritici (strain R3-111a-1) TaxID=644352 RepID=J3NJU1_GAET3|nr:hypothetical protein GGTG_01522 [Gaeumannomyces tritici R3-111a-1]EJT81544.1 hypothetical protein GGTG_01522 [Gaeumannomyces tritici R3-111a-1]